MACSYPPSHTTLIPLKSSLTVKLNPHLKVVKEGFRGVRVADEAWTV